ncbi:reversion-inducing cysteine-rich protein with Kazal motifs-like [Gigantopelta aegis]|uniref:reversion-inducing cysteine-rich protein with Kazal motifs-like n=1 Tax=Gigantopelta aegis TaxID=1735272 RepID=UPI001B88BAF5|nr:reversion-inducing cysteine-rich protein with Kazal motifs-like [Gigantopelta aegis]
MENVVYSTMILHCLCVCVLIVCVQSSGSSCCSSIRHHPTCHFYCEQIILKTSNTQQLAQLIQAAQHCPSHLVQFWHCISVNVPVLRQIEKWPCCDAAVTLQCQRRCRQAHSIADITDAYCDINREKNLYQCLQKHNAGERCCSQSQAYSCTIVCYGYFLTSLSRHPGSKNLVLRHCKGTSRAVSNCVKNLSRSTRASKPQDNLPCCEKATTSHCRATCLRALQTLTAETDIIEEVIKSCGQPDVREPLWQCFMLPPSGEKNVTPPAIGIDSARLLCCTKAVTNRCRNLCTQTYNTGWAHHWTKFHNSCSYIQPVTTLEAPMHNCLTDVEEPCKMGCSGLSFCSNFNNRPTEHFRSCTRRADDDALNTIKHWQRGMINLPQMTIPVKDIRKCEPDTWKAVACALQIKPCHRKPSPLSICQEDCIYILNKCVDNSRLSGDQTVPKLCNPLPKRSEPGACIAAFKYLTKSSSEDHISEVTNPCHPNPCELDKLCQIRRHRCKHKHKCLPYICKAACHLGQVSTFLVPHGAIVRIPDSQNMLHKKRECYKSCHCSHQSKIENCTPLPCVERRHCNIGTGHRKEHGVQFPIDGKPCICYSGELICGQRTCPVQSQVTSSQATGLGSGNCPFSYVPVCAANGKTYPNSCFAKCAGYERRTMPGACNKIDPCTSHKCHPGTRCVHRHQVCLTLPVGQTCPQYECVSVYGDSTECNQHHHDTVCDTLQEEFSNTCSLYSSNRTIMYRGHCMSNCARVGVVCGHNGEVYSSECAALADRTTVDYSGECRTVGNLTAGAPVGSSCGHVKCPQLRPKSCHGVTPSGACCPICAAQLQILFDSRLVTVAEQEVRDGHLTVRVILDLLSDLLMVAECDVFGYLSVGGDLVVLIAPVKKTPTELQVQACSSEAERLEHLFSTGSPTLLSYLMLTPLLLAPVQTPSIDSSTSGASTRPPVLALSSLISAIAVYTIHRAVIRVF